MSASAFPVLSKYTKASRRALFLLDQCLTFSQIKQIQSHLTVCGTLKDPYAAAKIISFCAFSHLSHAEALFLRLPSRSTFIWNTMFRAFVEQNQPLRAITLYKHMLWSSSSPNNYTFSFLIRASIDLCNKVLGFTLHALAIKFGWESYDFVRNGLVHFYASSGQMNQAHDLCGVGVNPDLVTWTALIGGYLKCGEVLIARKLFDEMPVKNVVSWSTMVAGYVRLGLFEDALDIFNNMQLDGFKPNHGCIVCALTACAFLGSLEQGMWIHAYVQKHKMELDRVLGAALVDMYAKCGCIEIACRVFDEMHDRDVIAYSCMISGLANHGQGENAIELFARMRNEGVMPNEVTFICLLNAYSQMGMVDEGLRVFDEMRTVYGIEPGVEHYGCLVDLLGRAGKLEDAKQVVVQMPMKPDSYVLGALLNACRIHGAIELGEEIFDSLAHECRVEHDGVHVLLSNMYASANKWDDVVNVRKGMEFKTLRKSPGCSLITLSGKVCEFVAGDDRSQAVKDEISLLSGMEKHLKSLPLHNITCRTSFLVAKTVLVQN